MLEFLSANLPLVLCFLFGVGLLVAEVFMPGFGVAGISGILLELACIVLTYLYHGGLAALGVTIVISYLLRRAVLSHAGRSASQGTDNLGRRRRTSLPPHRDPHVGQYVRLVPFSMEEVNHGAGFRQASPTGGCNHGHGIPGRRQSDVRLLERNGNATQTAAQTALRHPGPAGGTPT